MGHQKRLRIFVGFLKDKASFIKTTFSSKRQTSSIRRAVLRATSHVTSTPPSDKRIAAVLHFGHGSRPRASACIQALMDRLHATRNAFVALKCLFIIHHIIKKGSFILKDQLSIYPSYGGRNSLNLSMFRDKSDLESWELSSWVRWYASVLEINLTVSRVLGYHLCSPKATKKINDDKQEKVLTLLSSDLLREIYALVSFVEEITDVPNTLNLQSNNLIHEIVGLVGGDYRLIQQEIFLRVGEIDERMVSLSREELTQFLNALKRLENCEDRLLRLFVNRNKNHGLWNLIRETTTKITVVAVNKNVQEKALMKIWRRDDSTELSRIRQPFVGAVVPVNIDSTSNRGFDSTMISR
ncbi:putative clathrin assembly protein At4g40080 [Mangifera indica]|uniref:putative clathrin assembly protein At4g40080 n=1 Tax=Mangifera indica TaxID=29780 RepID=UPI001CFA8D31|nr:putative clathrin assembly protein At4g40080 [Mangifera indica]